MAEAWHDTWTRTACSHYVVVDVARTDVLQLVLPAAAPS